MNCAVIQEILQSRLSLLFSCQEERDGVKISTPYLYPNGDYVDIYLLRAPEGWILTDAGETAGYLADYGLRLRQSPKRRKIVDDVLLTHGVEWFQGELRLHLTKEDDLAWAVTRLGQAIIQIGDLIFSLRTGVLATFKEEVAEFWVEMDIPYEEDYLVIGGSGESYKVDFYVSTPLRPWLVEALSSSSSSYANFLVSRTVRIWHDVHRADGRYGYITLIDDSTDVWKPEWLDQLADFSEVTVWSQREALLRLLKPQSVYSGS